MSHARQRGLFVARRQAEQLVELLVRHRQAGAIVEIRHVEPERSVGLEVDQVVADQARKPRLPIGRKAHQLVLAGIDPEAGVIRERRIEQSEAVREADLLDDVDPVAVAERGCGGAPLADAVHRQHQRVLERRRIERARGMGVMMLGEQQPFVVEGVVDAPKVFGQ
jgi:hypothetical protein